MERVAMLDAAGFMGIGAQVHSEKFKQALEVWGVGCIELVDDMVSYAPVAVALLDAAYIVTGDYPGVWSYEVAEEFGIWFINTVILHAPDGKHLDEKMCIDKLRVLTLDFYAHTDGTVPDYWHDLNQRISMMEINREMCNAPDVSAGTIMINGRKMTIGEIERMDAMRSFGSSSSSSQVPLPQTLMINGKVMTLRQIENMERQLEAVKAPDDLGMYRIASRLEKLLRNLVVVPDLQLEELEPSTYEALDAAEKFLNELDHESGE